METLFQIATRVSTPLSLAGLFGIILFFIFRAILAKQIYPQLTRALAGGIINTIVNRLFVLALVAMILGVSSYVLVASYPHFKPEYVNVGTDRDKTLDEVIAAVAVARNVTIVFNRNCGPSVRGAVVEKGTHEGNTLKELIENFKQRIKGDAVDYSVIQEGARRYEIVCH